MTGESPAGSARFAAPFFSYGPVVVQPPRPERGNANRHSRAGSRPPWASGRVDRRGLPDRLLEHAADVAAEDGRGELWSVQWLPKN